MPEPTMPPKWGGTRATKARATIAKRLPAPCVRCGVPVVPGMAWDVDHIVPRALGGSDQPSNLGPAHATCNRREGGRRGGAITAARRAPRRRAMDSEQSRGITGI